MKNNIYVSFLLIIFLANCATTSNVGPQYRSNNSNTSNPIAMNVEPFDVAITIFNPGISDQDSYGEDGVWPELRRSESMYMAVQLRDTLAKTQRYGAVRVTPDSSSSADVYIKAKINKSNGEDVSLRVIVADSTGKKDGLKKITNIVLNLLLLIILEIKTQMVSSKLIHIKKFISKLVMTSPNI